MVYAMLWNAMVRDDECDSMSRYAMVGFSSVMLQDVNVMLWDFSAILWYGVCCKKKYAWSDCKYKHYNTSQIDKFLPIVKDKYIHKAQENSLYWSFAFAQAEAWTDDL